MIIYCDQQMQHSELHSFLGGEVGIFSCRSPAKSTANEDAAAVMPFADDAGVLIIADGMGGHAAGEVAARLAVESMLDAIQEARDGDMLLRTGIINGFERANQAVQQLATGAGTTLAAVELSGGIARPYHAGDSVVLVSGARGRIKLQTTSHSPVGFGLAAGLLDDEEAMRHEQRHLVLNAIGSEAMRIEIGASVRLAVRDTVLLASDGLTDNLSIDQVVETIRKGPLVRSLDQLVRDCRDRMDDQDGQGDHPNKPDDLTIIAFRKTPTARKA